MKKTPIYKEIEKFNPGLAPIVLNPSRLKLLSKPEMIRSLIHMDQVVEHINTCPEKRT